MGYKTIWEQDVSALVTGSWISSTCYSSRLAFEVQMLAVRESHTTDGQQSLQQDRYEFKQNLMFCNVPQKHLASLLN